MFGVHLGGGGGGGGGGDQSVGFGVSLPSVVSIIHFFFNRSTLGRSSTPTSPIFSALCHFIQLPISLVSFFGHQMVESVILSSFASISVSYTCVLGEFYAN